jgi:DNA polymerase-1
LNSFANELTMTTLLIDADMLLFRTMAAWEIEASLGDEVWVRWAELNTVREEFWKTIDEWLERWPGADYRLCWTGPSAFRKRIAPDYKANRAGVLKPIGYKVMKRELLDEPTSFLHDEIEADDWLGILAGALREAGQEPIIVSGDKDLDQIHGRHWWPYGRKKQEEPGLEIIEENQLTDKVTEWIVDETYAAKFFYSQVLIGDSTDNIPGCSGIGKVGAKKIVDSLNTAEPVECWQEIVGQFEKALKKKDDVREPEDVALQQARLVRILRHGEYNAETCTVDLWIPPTLKS